MSNYCPYCKKTIGHMPTRDVFDKPTRLPDCPYRPRSKKK